MKLSGRPVSRAMSYDGKPMVTFEFNRVKDVNDLIKLDFKLDYNIDIKKGGSRSILQNNLMWAIITDICKVMYGRITEENRWEVYTYGIEQAGVEYEDYEVKREAIKIMQRGCRASRIIEEYEDTVIIRCFTGSSRFNKKEMGELIDWFLDYAAKSNIPIIDYRTQYLEIYG